MCVCGPQPCYLKDWELHVQFKIHGSGKKNLHGDGIALWYTRDRLQAGTMAPAGNGNPWLRFCLTELLSRFSLQPSQLSIWPLGRISEEAVSRPRSRHQCVQMSVCWCLTSPLPPP